MPGVGDGVEKPRTRTAFELAVEVAAVVVVAAPAALVTLPLGWLIERRIEFNARLRHFLTIGSLIVGVAAMLTVGTVGYANAWGALWSALIGSGAVSVSDVVTLLVVGLPVGFGSGLLVRRLFEWQRGRHPIHGPGVKHKKLHRHQEHRAALASDPESVPLTAEGAPVLGAWLSGDKDTGCQVGQWAVLPSSVSHLIAIGATGSGKTEAILRLAMSSLAAGYRVIVIDAKEDPETAHRLAKLIHDSGAVQPTRMRLWPESGPMDLFRGGTENPQVLLDKVHGMADFTEPYYEAISTACLRLALSDPRGTPNSLGELIERLDASVLKATWAGTPWAEVAAGLTSELVRGVRLRYWGLSQALEGIGAVTAPSGGRGWSFEDADFSWVTLPTSTQPQIAASFARALLIDLIGYIRSPERRPDRRPILLVVEEIGAILGQSEVTARTVLEGFERARSAGVRLVLSGQSADSFGDPATQSRLLRSGSAVLCMRMPVPEAVLELVGTRQGLESSLGVSASGDYLDQGSTRVQEQWLVDPNSLRRAPVGRACLLDRGTHSWIQIAQVSG